MTDADNDEVRCRWARGSSECGEICGDRGLRYGGMQNVRSNFSLDFFVLFCLFFFLRKRSLRWALPFTLCNREVTNSGGGGGGVVIKIQRAAKGAVECLSSTS